MSIAHGMLLRSIHQDKVVIADCALPAASTFNSLLSSSALFLGGAQYPDRPLRENPAALYFYQIAVSETRKELDRVEDGITDGLIGTVLGLYAFTVRFASV